MGKDDFFTTQIYDVPFGQVGKRSVATLSVDPRGTPNQQWNVKRAIVFHAVILQRVLLISGAKNIHDWITSRLDLWNKGVYDEFVQDSYGAASAYLGKSFGKQTQEQCYRTFSKLIMCGKLREVVWFIFKQDMGVFF